MNFLASYLIRTPTMRNDDDYMIYGMMIHNTMVLTNDQFRDHLKDMDLKTKCYVKSMSIKYSNNKLLKV
jgi:IS1 family transposase